MNWEEVGAWFAGGHKYGAMMYLAGALLLALFMRLAASIWQKRRPVAHETVWVVEILRLLAWLALLLGAALSVRFTDWPVPAQETIASVLVAAGILLVARTLVRIGTAILQRQWMRWFAGLPPTTLMNVVLALSVYTLALLMVLHQFGLSITPLLTAVGVGGLAVALGIQDTLSNLFAGISITLARLIRPGDYLRLENGMEGTVQDIGWRYTTLRTQQHTLIVIPNSRLSQLITVNFSLPETRTLINVPITLPLSDSPIEQLTAFEQAVQQVSTSLPTVLTQPPPSCRIVGITDKGQLQVQIQFWLSNPQQVSESVHEVYRRVLETILPGKPSAAG
ncbi:MAG: mechanosensitive ion channel family protein [Gemmatales bacterium]|nr:mechanosensitive ion channel family protein [Gemmatales bacterium]MDW8221473.1 mechanosensitive ion channel [Gemmatales bacterium]